MRPGVAMSNKKLSERIYSEAIRAEVKALEDRLTKAEADLADTLARGKYVYADNQQLRSQVGNAQKKAEQAEAERDAALADRIPFAEKFAAEQIEKRRDVERLNDAMQESLIGTRQQRDNFARQLHETQEWLSASEEALGALAVKLERVRKWATLADRTAKPQIRNCFQAGYLGAISDLRTECLGMSAVAILAAPGTPGVSIPAPKPAESQNTDTRKTRIKEYRGPWTGYVDGHPFTVPPGMVARVEVPVTEPFADVTATVSGEFIEVTVGPNELADGSFKQYTRAQVRALRDALNELDIEGDTE